MSDLSENPKVISNKVINLLVSNTLHKNGINLKDVKGKVADEQKQALSLSYQV